MKISKDPKTNKLLNKIIYAAIITLISIIIAFALNVSDPGKRLHNSIYDTFFRIKTSLFKADNAKTDDVIIVAIDDASLQNFQNFKNVLWPWPRNIYAILAQHLVNEGAKAVVFDIIFNSPDIDRADSYGEDNDYMFYQVITETEKTILAFNIDDQMSNENKIDAVKITNGDLFNNVREYNSISYLPYELFRMENDNFGYVDIEAGTDGVIREYMPFVKIKDQYYPSLSAATYIIANNSELPEDLFINNNGSFRLNWYGQGGVNQSFHYQPVLMVISDFINSMRGNPKEIPEGTFQDKVVFIGATARGLLDMKNTPFTKDEAYPGVEIHATAYLNMLQRNEIKNPNLIMELSIYFILLFILMFFGVKSKSIYRYSIFYFLLLVIIIFSQFFVFSSFDLMTLTAFVLIAFIVAYAVTQVYNYITEGRTSNMIKNALGTYLSPELAKQVAESEKTVTVGGKNVNASAMFIDIAGFTTFSEKNSVEKVVQTLNLYLEKFSESIMANKGFINKYLGDGLMALFGSYPQYDDHADMVVISAMECYKINKELAPQYGLNVRIGVNTGKMIAGNLGGGGKLEFTAIGDSVNTTSRLEGANKFFSTHILVGEDTYKALKGKYDLNYIGKFSLKGKDIPYGIYYFVDGFQEEKKKFVNLIEAYEKKDLQTFKKYLQHFINLKTNFGPALYYLNYFKNNPKKFGEPIKFTEK